LLLFRRYEFCFSLIILLLNHGIFLSIQQDGTQARQQTHPTEEASCSSDALYFQCFQEKKDTKFRIVVIEITHSRIK
jgi:hypothetical protein